MGKTGKIILAIVCVVIILVAGFAATVAVDHYFLDDKLGLSAKMGLDKIFEKDNDNDENNEKNITPKKEEEKEDDYIPTEEEIQASQELIEEIKNDFPDKDPESIEIPENATKQEKKEIEEEKAYWTVVSGIKELWNTKVASDRSSKYYNSTIRNVENLYSGGQMCAEVNYLYTEHGLQKQRTAIVKIYSSTNPGYRDIYAIKERLDNCNAFKVECDYTNDGTSEYADLIYQNSINNDAHQFECASETYDENGKIDTVTIKCSNKDIIGAVLVRTYKLSKVNQNLTNQELLEKMKNDYSSLGITRPSYNGSLTVIDYNWKDATLEYTSSASASSELERSE